MYSLLWFVNSEGAIGVTVEFVKGSMVGWIGGRRKNGWSGENTHWLKILKTEISLSCS
jgi:hypothetical protein